MITPLLPDNEQLRLQALFATGLLDTTAEERFDRLTRVAQLSFKVEIALITLLDTQRQWFKSKQGLSIQETDRNISFCGHAILTDKLLIIEDTQHDPRFIDNPLVTGEPYIRFYAGAPLHTRNGYRIGTLCIIDRQPRQLTAEDRQLLRDLADAVEEQINQRTLEAALQLSESRAELIIEGADVGTWQWEPHTDISHINERWAQMLGYELKELLPVTRSVFQNLVHPDDLAGVLTAVAQHQSGITPVYHYKYRMRHKQGHWVWIYSRGCLLGYSKNNQPRAMYGTHLDITAEQDALVDLEHKNQALILLNRLAFDLTGTLDEQIQQALHLGCDYLQMDFGAVSEILGNTYVVRWCNAPSESGITAGLQLMVQDTYCYLLLQQSGILAISHMGASAFQQEPCYQQHQLESYLGIQLRVGSQLFGTLSFAADAARERPFNSTDKMFLGLLGHWLSELLNQKTQQERLDKLIEQMPGALYQYRVWPDGHHSFPYSSDGIKKLYRVTPEQIQQDARAAYKYIYHEDIAHVDEAVQMSAQHLSQWHAQYRIVQADGSLRWVEGRSLPERLEDGSVVWHGYVVDIQHEKEAELALADSERRLRGLFELSPIGIALNDFKSGEFIDVNQALVNITGLSKEQLLAADYRALTPPHYYVQDRQAIQLLLEQGTYPPYEKSYLRYDGTHLSVRQQGILMTDTGGRTLLWSLVEDISALKKAERIKQNFIATVSHELRTPLTSITGALSLLEKEVVGELPVNVRQMLKVAANNSQRLHLLINDLLDIEKLVSDKVHFVLKPYDLTALVKEAILMNSPLGEAQGITLSLAATLENAWVLTDKDRFLQALSNLQSNAIKYSPANGQVTMTITQPKEGVLCVAVQDQGPGIPESFQSRIFEKFAQADTSDTRKKGGTGLGLAITKQLMERMQGSIGFISEAGQGSCFWLTLPAATQVDNSV